MMNEKKKTNPFFIVIRVLILVLIFLLTVTVTTLFNHQQETNDISELDAATLPVAYVEIDGTLANRMYGCREQMQVDFNRDSLTPVDTQKEITIVLKPYEQDILGLSYEVRTSDGSKVLENQKTRDLQEEDGYLKTTIALTSEEMLMNQEYSLQIQVDLEEGPVYYYTRLVQRSRLRAGEYLEFAQYFYQKCLNKDGAYDLAAYLEPEEDNDEEDPDYTQVNIHSSVDTITWGSLSPQIVRTGVPTIKEINETTGSVSIVYQISCKDEEDNTQYYEVTDFYRMRYTQERVMLLDFERTASQIFDAELPVVTNDSIVLGITSDEVQYLTAADGLIVAFVQNGDLWTYDISGGRMTCVYSFREEAALSDERDTNNQHDYKILRLSDNGDMDFVVYGYMDRGPHEGYVGISVCHYNFDQNAVEEQAFIPSTLSFEFLSQDLKKLIYVNADNQVFFLTESNLYQVDLEEQTYSVIAENIDMDSFVTSADNAYAAWGNGGSDTSTKITEMNFAQAEKRKIKVNKKKKYIKALGYMNDDLVYGIANQENVMIDSNGDVIFAMNKVKIENFSGEVKKAYDKEGYYITDVSVTEALMAMELSEKSGDVFVASTFENIMNNKKAVEETVSITSSVDDNQGNLVEINLGQQIQETEPVLVVSRFQGLEESNVVDLDITPTSQDAYYVYAYGALDSSYTSPAQAILRADECMGVVLDREQQYVWERGNRSTRLTMDVANIPPAVLAGPLDTQALSKELGSAYQVLNLTGCSLDNVLYFVGAQQAVIAARGDGSSYVIVGYDENNITVYDPATGAVGLMGIGDSTAAFEAAGNVFITYMETLE